MTIQKIASHLKTLVMLTAATKANATYTSAAITLSDHGYPQVARAILSGTIAGGSTGDAYLTDNSTGSHTQITGSAITQLTATGNEYGPEVMIRAGATELKLVVVVGVAGSEYCGLVEMDQKSYET